MARHKCTANKETAECLAEVKVEDVCGDTDNSETDDHITVTSQQSDTVETAVKTKEQIGEGQFQCLQKLEHTT
jgi:hypothetical protein